jgi:hypothetical protein
MIVCFDCSRRTKATLDSLLESGQYRDYGEVISLAVSNLAILQDEIGRSGDLIIGTGSGTSLRNRRDAAGRGKESPEQLTGQYEHNADPAGIPAIFRLHGLQDSSPPLVDMPDDVWAIGQEIPLDRWVFGQYNRLLPAKASCRALAHLTIDEPTGVLLEEAAEQIAENAAVLGEFLARHDREHKIGRDKTLSTAFPSADKETSLQRFATQFVASVNRQGQMSGLLVDLKLVNGRGTRVTHLMLTDVGWEFAIMPNPVFDGMQERPTQKFSENERDFLLNHIARAVPVEDFAYRAVLTAIQQGADTPDAVGAALRQYVPRNAESSLSESFLSSQRSGAISRMTDLGLVERVRDGVRVSYVVTDIGRSYLQRRNGAPLGKDQSRGVSNGQ